MMEQQVERITRLLRALDIADGAEDYVIHRDSALAYVRSELERIESGARLTPDDISKAELEASLDSLRNCPEAIRRKSDAQILEILMQTKKATG